MKHKIYILILFIIGFSACNKGPLTCDFSGQKVNKTVGLEEFNAVEVNPQIELTIFHSDENKLEIITDKDVIDNIDFQVVDGLLILTNQTECLVQNTDAVAYINLYAKNVSQLTANTDLDIHSGNIWRFNSMEIWAENYTKGTNNIADFDLHVEMNRIKIIANGTSIFNIKGTCQDLFVGFYGVTPIIKAQNLKAQKITIYQRSNADMHLYPVEEIKGDLYGYGDVYLYHRPPVVSIVKHYAGHIYFVD